MCRGQGVGGGAIIEASRLIKQGSPHVKENVHDLGPKPVHRTTVPPPPYNPDDLYTDRGKLAVALGPDVLVLVIRERHGGTPRSMPDDLRETRQENTMTSKAVWEPMTSKAVWEAMTSKAVWEPMTSKAVWEAMTSKAVWEAMTSKAVWEAMTSKAVWEAMTSKAVWEAMTSKAVWEAMTSKAVWEAMTSKAVWEPMS